jgi:hypothetical protein
MAFASSTIVYAALRTIVAGAIVVLAALGGRRALPLVGQTVSDASCLGFMLGYVDADLRAALGWLALPLFIYVVAWEGWGALRAAAAPADGDVMPDDVESDLLGWFGGIWRFVYRILFVTPPIAAGGFLVLALLYPGAWAFPTTLAPLRCSPATVALGDTVTLRMNGPHGGEVGVTTPANTFLYIVDFAPLGTPPSERFERRERWSLATRGATGRVLQGAPPGYPRVPIFTDTGSYVFRVSEVSELSGSLGCTVRYTGERQRP